jgi:hypothetical protein
LRNIAPDIMRQRLLLEGYFTVPVDRAAVGRYLTGVAAQLGLRTYAEPIVHAPSGLGKPENQGFDGFVPLIDSGIALYVWSERRFFSALLYTCKAFDVGAAVAYTRTFFGAPEIVDLSF